MLTRPSLDVWSMKAREEDMICAGPRFWTGKPRDISIYFSSDTSLPALHATVQAYRSHDGIEDAGGLRTADFPREMVPSYQMLQQWVETLIEKERKSDFQHSLQLFLLAYSRDGHGLPKVCDPLFTSPVNSR